MYPRNPYYENTDVRNKITAGEDILAVTQNSPLVTTILNLKEWDVPTTQSIYHVGFGLGQYFATLKPLLPKVRLLGCEFDPMFLNFGQNHFKITENAESVHIANSYDNWKPAGNYDIVFVEDWFCSMNKMEQEKLLKSMQSMAKSYILIDGGDLEFLKELVGEGWLVGVNQEKVVVITKEKFLGKEKYEPSLESIFDGMGIPYELREEKSKEFYYQSVSPSKDLCDKFKNEWADLGEHPPIRGEE